MISQHQHTFANEKQTDSQQKHKIPVFWRPTPRVRDDGGMTGYMPAPQLFFGLFLKS